MNVAILSKLFVIVTFASRVTLRPPLIVFEGQTPGGRAGEREATSQSIYETGLTLKCMILTK